MRLSAFAFLAGLAGFICPEKSPGETKDNARQRMAKQIRSRPLSPGVLAAAVLDPDSAAQIMVLARGLSDSDARIRAAAARSASAAGVIGLAGPLEDVLARETDDIAAIEELSALLNLLSPEPWDRLLPWFFCLSSITLESTLPLLARSADAVPLYFLSGLAELPVSDEARSRYFYVATGGSERAHRSALQQARVAGDSVAIRAIDRLRNSSDTSRLSPAFAIRDSEINEVAAAECIGVGKAPADPLRLRSHHYPPGFAQDLLRVVGCRLEGDTAHFSATVVLGFSPQASRLLSATITSDSGCRFATLVLLSTFRLGPWMPAHARVRITGSVDMRAWADSDSLTPYAWEPSVDEAATVSSRIEVATYPSLEAEGLTRLGSTLVAPRIRRQVSPRYPESAWVRGIEGAVSVEAMISESGQVRNISVLDAPDQSLATAAVEAIKQWHFAPGMVDLRPVPYRAWFTVSFSFKGDGRGR